MDYTKVNQALAKQFGRGMTSWPFRRKSRTGDLRRKQEQ